MARSLDGGIRTAALVVVDAVVYGVAVAAIAVVAAVTASVVTGGGLVRAKALLFVVGFLLMAYATVRLWPSSPADLERGAIPEVPDEESRIQRAVRALPPLRWLPRPPPHRSFSPAGKLFLGSLVVLAVSFAMETVFGVA